MLLGCYTKANIEVVFMGKVASMAAKTKEDSPLAVVLHDVDRQRAR